MNSNNTSNYEFQQERGNAMQRRIVRVTNGSNSIREAIYYTRPEATQPIREIAPERPASAESTTVLHVLDLVESQDQAVNQVETVAQQELLQSARTARDEAFNHPGDVK